MTVRLYKRKGELTVFLSLILAVVLGLLCVIFESARSQSIKFQMETAMDSALRSCFGEYHKKLYEIYDLLYIDSSYKAGSAEIDNIKDHLNSYMDENLDFEKDGSDADLFKTDISDMEIEKYLLASDSDGMSVYLQAADYLKEYGDLSHTGRISAIRSCIGRTDEESLYGGWDASLARVSSFGVEFINPSAVVRAMVPGGASQIISARSKHMASLPYASVPSARSLKAGNYGELPNEDEELVFTEYLMQKCGSFTHPKDYAVMGCEQEYVLYGKSSDRENTKLLCERLIRIFSKRIYDSLGGREGEMKAYAEIIVPPPRDPEDPLGWFDREALVDAVADSLRYAWAQCEGILKVDRLLGGGKVNPDNPSSDWILPLMEIMMYRSKMGGSGGSGYTYEEYIACFLKEVSRKNVCLRFLDIVEINMRKSGSSGFMADGCLEYMKARADTASVFGYEYNITRDYAYEDRYREKTI